MRRPLIVVSLSSLLVGYLVAGAGCGGAGGSDTTGTGGSGGTGATSGQQVEIFSWWVAPGEAEALQALVDVNKANYPGDRIFNAAADSGTDSRMLLAQRLADNDPPDLFQENAYELPTFVATNPNTLNTLDNFVSQQGLLPVMLPEILSSVTVNGHIYAMPNDIHRENALFYNKQIFASFNLQPPTSTDELLSACATLKAGGVTPIAVVDQGWVLRILFNSLAMGQMGSTAFHDFMAGGPRDDAKLMAAIDLFDNVLSNYTNTNASDSSLAWTDAAAMMSNGQAAMFAHGDWAKGYYVQLGQTPGVDFGVVGAPGAADMFWYDLDTFAMPQGSPYPTGAMDFLTTIGSIAGQVAFNRLKGSSPIRTDVPLDQFDSEARVTWQDLQNARYRMAVVNYDAWDNAFAAFAVSHDKNALFQAYVDTPPVQ